MKRRPLFTGIFVAFSAAIASCHASTVVMHDRYLSVCVDTQSFTGLGEVNAAVNARVFAIVSEKLVEFEHVGELDGCAEFEASLYSHNIITSVTALDSSIGATTLLNPSADALRLRINDISLPIESGRAVPVSGRITRSEETTAVTIGGEGIDNISLYGAYENTLEQPYGKQEFELKLGSWAAAPPAHIYFIERWPEGHPRVLPNVTHFSVYGRDGIVPFFINFPHLPPSNWRNVTHRMHLTAGLLDCQSLMAAGARAYSAPQRGAPEVMEASVGCKDDEEITVQGFVNEYIYWLILEYRAEFLGVMNDVNATIFIDSRNQEEYSIPNLAAYELDVSNERGVSGTIALSGASSSSSLSLRSFLNTVEGERVWDIFTEQNDGIEVNIDEYTRIREAVDEALGIESITYQLILSDGYDGNAWEAPPVNAASHHSLFSMQLTPSR